MRIYKGGQQAIVEAQIEVMQFGVIVKPNKMQAIEVKYNDDFITKELQLYTMVITDPTDLHIVCRHLDWCEAEFKERIYPHPKNPGEAWKLRADLWNPMIKDHEGTGHKGFSYTYGDRIWGQIFNIVNELRDNPDSRQCVMMIWDRVYDSNKIGSSSRVPCSIYYQFQIRNGKLDIMYHMRSTDVMEHFSNDLYLAHKMQAYIADRVVVPTGKLFFTTGSLHSYKKDWIDYV